MTHYETLGVKKDATPEEIKKAYRQKAKDWHPDGKQFVNEVEAQERMAEINASYEVLSDPEKRKEYDGGMLNAFAKIFQSSKVEIKVASTRPLRSKTKTCPSCKGRKKSKHLSKDKTFVVEEDCPRCKGRGVVEKRNRKGEANYYRKDHKKGTKTDPLNGMRTMGEVVSHL